MQEPAEALTPPKASLAAWARRPVGGVGPFGDSANPVHDNVWGFRSASTNEIVNFIVNEYRTQLVERRLRQRLRVSFLGCKPEKRSIRQDANIFRLLSRKNLWVSPELLAGVVVISRTLGDRENMLVQPKHLRAPSR